MVQVIKLYIPSHSGIPEIKRLTVSSNALNSHVFLVEKIIVSVPKLTGKCFELCWKDNEGDDISITDDSDLAHAIANLEDDLLKLYVRFTGTDAFNAPAKVATTSEEHPHVKCDGCNTKIVGFRYKCLQCHDFDLCSDCNSAGKHSFHDMLKLVAPCTFPRQWLFMGWRKLFRSLFGFEAITTVIDRSDSADKNSASHCPYLASLNSKSKESDADQKKESSPTAEIDGNKCADKNSTSHCPFYPFTNLAGKKNNAPKKSEASSTAKPDAEEKSKPSTPKTSQKKPQFPPGFPFNPEFFPNSAAYAFGSQDSPNIHDTMRNIITDNAGPVCDFINNLLKPLGADLRVEVETPNAQPKAENEKQQEKTKDVKVSVEREIPIQRETPCASNECSGARPKSRSPSVEKDFQKMSHGLFTHEMGDSGISNPEVVDIAKPAVNEAETTNTADPYKDAKTLMDLSVQEMNGNATEGWTVINPSELKQDESDVTVLEKANAEVKYPVIEEVSTGPVSKASNTEVKYIVEEATSPEPSKRAHASAPPSDDGVEDISKLDPEVANSLLKMRSMGFTNEGGWLLRLLQAKQGNIYHVLDSLYPQKDNAEQRWN